MRWVPKPATRSILPAGRSDRPLSSGGDLRLGPTSARLDQSPAISLFAKLETPATNTFVVHYE